MDMRSDRNIFMPIETKVREFEGKVLLAYHLAQEGFNVYMGSRNTILSIMKYSKNGIYFPKSIAKELEDKYKELVQPGNEIYLLHAEGGIFYEDYTESVKYVYPKELMKYVNTIFVYGDAIKDRTLEVVPGSEDVNIVTAGNPPFDLIKPKYNVFFKKVIKDIGDKFGNFILINTNFGLANPTMDNDDLIKYYRENQDFTEKLKERLFERKAFLEKVTPVFLKDMQRLIEATPDKSYIIRPHPEEKLDIYDELFSELPNVTVTREGNVLNWIKVSKMVIHFDCTTGLESVLAGKHTVSYLPLEERWMMTILPILVSKKIKEFDKLLEHVKSQNLSNIVEHQIDEKSFERVKGFLHNIEVESTPIIVGELKKFDKKSEIRSAYIFEKLDYFFRKRVRRMLYGKNRPSSNRKFGTITSEETLQLLDQLNQSNNEKVDFSVKEIVSKELIKIKCN